MKIRQFSIADCRIFKIEEIWCIFKMVKFPLPIGSTCNCQLPEPIFIALRYNSIKMLADSIVARIQSEVASWPGVTVEAHRGGMVFFQVGRREIGHLHGSRFADLPFPVRVREELVASGRVDLHYLHPKSGWTTCYIRGEQDIEPIVELFRLNYNRPWLNSQSPR